jgi:DNA-binding NtrC family response regulator
MKKTMNILVIEDEPSIRLGLCAVLKDMGHRVDAAGNAADGLYLFKKRLHDLVITDLVMPGGKGGLDMVAEVKELRSACCVIVMTAFANVKTAVEAMRLGAFDYITKPFDPEELQITIDKFTEQARLEEENSQLREELHGKRFLQNITGESPAIKALCDKIRAVACSDASVLILGETGTGKELAADALCTLSTRRNKPFIKINCAAIPETLFESELFGHEKGAFTGAAARRTGKLEAANGGTVLFDEIGDMPLAIQAKLLRVLEERTVERVGGNSRVPLDVRFLFATSRNLKAAIAAGAFRQDLYYRIHVLLLQIPPLRERRSDIQILARHFLDDFSKRNGRGGIKLTPEAAAALYAYNYPGNVRELKHALEAGATLCPESTIDTVHLPQELQETSAGEAAIQIDSSDSLQEQLRSLERNLITRALEETEGRKSAAADRLGICRRTLWKKMRDLQIDSLEGEEEA